MNNPFKQYADVRLAHISMGEDAKRKVRQHIQSQASPRLSRKFVSATLAAVLALGTLTAFALTGGFGLFDLMGTVLPHMATVRPEADKLVRRDLAAYSFEHVDVAVKEAAYDGRYLRVAYSIKDRAATAPLGEIGKHLEMGPDFHFEAAEKDGIWWSTLDWALVDGQDANPLGMTFSVAGPENGEAITWVQFDVKELDLPDTFTVRLPLRGQNTPKELDFTMDKGDMSDVYALAPPPDKRIGNYVVHIEEIVISPIRTYMTVHLIVDAGVSARECWSIANNWMDATLSDADDSNPQQWTDTASGAKDNMEFVRVDKPDGTFDFEDRVIDPAQPVTMQVLPEFAPPETYPDAFRLGYDTENFILIPFEKQETP